MKTIKSKPRIGIITTHMDGRLAKGTAIFIHNLVSGLADYRGMFDISLIHRNHSEDKLYEAFSEIIMPRVSLPRFSGILSELFFYLMSWVTGNIFDILFYPYAHLHPLFFLAPARRIVFMTMDGGPRTAWRDAPKGYGKPTLIPRIFSFRINAFLAFSEFGRQGISHTLRISLQKVFIVPCGVSDRFKPMAIDDHTKVRLAQDYGITFPYILDVSRFDPHKNILGVLEAYALLVKKGCPENLVFVGGEHMPDYSAKVRTRIRELHLEERVQVAPYIPENDLPYIYSGASVFLFPSFYEGFGLPLVEAMASGCPAVTSNTSSLGEVGGDAVLTVNPDNPSDIAEAVERLLTNENLRCDLIQRGLARASIYTWANTTAALVKVFSGVLSEKER